MGRGSGARRRKVQGQEALGERHGLRRPAFKLAEAPQGVPRGIGALREEVRAHTRGRVSGHEPTSGRDSRATGLQERKEHNGRGDDAQSIYAFRGARYENILRFPERNPGTEVFKLEITYRSTPQILDLTNASIRNNRNQFRKTLRPTRPDGPKPFLVPVRDVYEEARFVVGRALELRDEGVPLNRIGVLYRAHSHSMVLQGELARRGIPYEVRSGLRFFEQAHVKDVLAYLRVVHNPYDEVAWRRVLLMIPGIGNMRAARIWERIRGSSDPLDELEEAGDFLPSYVLPSWRRFVEDVKALREAQSPGESVEIVLSSDYRDYLRTTYDDPESRLEDLYQLAVLAGQYGSVEEFLTQLVLLGELYGGDLRPDLRDPERLVLSSVHQAKGLEWWAVFVLRVVEGAFPSPMSLREDEGEEEERRAFYVATTRAQQELYLLYPITDYTPSGSAVLMGPSRFIRELDEDLYQVVRSEEMTG
ncbi:MAG TPA: ATP-dependent helicase [Candidatus Latescibacteria bacterium]|nr:ATP-dependent helicase [Candidatus Latescibacterota bacterium]